MTEPDWIPPTEPEVEAGNVYVDIVIREFGAEKGVHAETAIAAAARMAGTFLFRSFNCPLKDLTPGSPVLSDAANEHGALLIRTLGAGLGALGVNLDHEKLASGMSDEHQPQVSVIETQARVEKQFREASVRFQLTAEQSAHACALAAAQLIQMTGSVLDPHVGFSVAVYGFVEGSKTAPIALDE
jgi:hypothetical protein